jgi:hypothetical protein
MSAAVVKRQAKALGVSVDDIVTWYVKSGEGDERSVTTKLKSALSNTFRRLGEDDISGKLVASEDAEMFMDIIGFQSQPKSNGPLSYVFEDGPVSNPKFAATLWSVVNK